MPAQVVVGRRVHGRRPHAAHRLPGDCRASGSPAAPRGRNRLEWPLGKWALKHGQGEVTATMPPGVDADDARSCGPTRSPRSIRCRAKQGRSTRSCRSATCRSPGRSPTRSTPTGSTSPTGWAATEKTYVEFKGRTACGAALADPVPRDQPRLAGERSRPGRHHDRLRRADRRDRHRRPRRVRRRDARRRSRSRASKGTSSATACARGTPSGATASPTW